MAYNPIKRKADYEKNKARALAANKNWRKENKDRHKEMNAIWYRKTKDENLKKYLLKYAKARAVKKKLDFNLTEEDIIIPEICPIMRVPFSSGRYSPSIDRIDCKKGYTKDNIQVISSLANRMKWDSSQEELHNFCNGILEGGYVPYVNPSGC